MLRVFGLGCGPAAASIGLWPLVEQSRVLENVRVRRGSFGTFHWCFRRSREAGPSTFRKAILPMSTSQPFYHSLDRVKVQERDILGYRRRLETLVFHDAVTRQFTYCSSGHHLSYPSYRGRSRIRRYDPSNLTGYFPV